MGLRSITGGGQNPAVGGERPSAATEASVRKQTPNVKEA